MKKVVILMLALALTLTLTACGKTWTCDICDKTFVGKAYYGITGSETLCKDCAHDYWMPLNYKNHTK